jgi:LmbE family N-acetylglucosaminyl deacetylase
MRVLVFGAHPDDCDLYAGGTAALWSQRGDAVRFVSVSDGSAGHFQMDPGALAERRRIEADNAARVIGIEYHIMGIADGQVVPSVENRLRLIREIRSFRPDLVVTHRPNDYHPDHRYTSTLVQDSAYMVTAPLVCPEVPHLERNPVIAYFYDDFTKPTRCQVDVAVDIDRVMDLKWDMLHAHASQFYEWLPYNKGILDEVPLEETARKAWLKKRWSPALQLAVVPSRERLTEIYGKDRASKAQFVEAFEVCEFGREPTPAELSALFPRS